MSKDDLSLRERAIHFHEAYVSFIEAGFTEHQALYLIGQAMRPQGGATNG